MLRNLGNLFFEYYILVPLLIYNATKQKLLQHLFLQKTFRKYNELMLRNYLSLLGDLRFVLRGFLSLASDFPVAISCICSIPALVMINLVLVIAEI